MDSLVDMTNSSMEGRTREKLDEDEISYADEAMRRSHTLAVSQTSSTRNEIMFGIA
jgi:hypothetical protein